MIAKSDLIILVVSASALGLGIYRWQQNTAAPGIAAVPADSRTVAGVPDEPLAGRPASADDDDVPASGGAGRSDGAAVVRRLPSTAPEPRDDAGSASVSGNERVPSVDNDGITPPEPRVGGAPEAPVTTSSESDETLYGRYRVQEGEYLGLIAERFDTSVADLRSINDIEGNLIFVGQELRYPLPAN